MLDWRKQPGSPKPVTEAGDEVMLLRNVRLLVVEDAPDNQVLIKRLLKPTGAEVEIAQNGEEGMYKALTQDFDLVLMDLQMPVMNGYEATQELRLRGYHRPILAVTAYAISGEKEKCLQQGFNDFITKPFTRKLLIETICHWLDLSSPQ